ncbi:RagB/SusD family nutrient uptake outer membrane protein [Aquimarina algiphila]|uniref:RagB/SusD family nutrient uptake outer membrane protein n=1 Tax=Aquimarina algiphila TaxID=2047982 RepID=UPI00232DF518|nr:RagB/SusD family nutrient uptake outer membrane protein [Aquimarina algiphila]
MKKICIYALSALSLVSVFYSCTDLEEELNQNLTAEEAAIAGSASDALNAAYDRLKDFQHTDFMFVLMEHPSDEIAGPTRGADWDDGGAWRALHLHTWNSSHPRVVDSWGSTLSGIFRATEVLGFNPDTSQKAQAAFLRSLFIYTATDLFGTVPLREPGEDLAGLPSVTANRTEAIDIAIQELEAELNNLPTETNPAIANIYAGHALLAKMYLNRAVYKATDADGTPQPGPFTFETADMNRVIELCDAIINSGNYSLEDDYFSSFSPTNTETSSEIIFVSQNTNDFAGEIRRFNFMTLHYNQNPGSWNGFVTLSDFYDSFEDSDVRKSSVIPNLSENSGLTGGFLIGQQFDVDGNALEDRQGNPLVFTRDFALANSEEVKGIRVVKYQPDYTNINIPNQDFVFYRYADVLLMKAEALLRTGNTGGALDIVNTIRMQRSASMLGTLTEADLLAERGREMYWEGHRRNDQIRFGTLLDPVQERPTASDRTKLVFPIPAEALATNPNLTQNPGY